MDQTNVLHLIKASAEDKRLLSKEIKYIGCCANIFVDKCYTYMAEL